MGELTRADYENSLNQGTRWPSESNGDWQYIDQMAPQHAIACYHKLRRACLANWPADCRSSLAQALLRQAIGPDYDQGVLLQRSTSFRELDEDTLLEVCFDALEEVDHLEPAPTHKIKRAVALTKAVSKRLDQHITITKEKK